MGESHYYPFGLSIEGISSKAFLYGNNQNKHLFNGKEKQDKEFSDGSGLEWYDYGARNYDPQVGRWLVPDSKAHNYIGYSPYGFVNNNPILFIDPNGKEIWINYGDAQSVQYKNGKLYDKENNEYKGKDKFVMSALKSLKNISKSKNGTVVIENLMKNENKFTYVNETPKNKDGEIKNTLTYNPNKEGGGTRRVF